MIQLPDEVLLYILQCLPALSSFTHEVEFEDYKQTSKTLVNICQASTVLRNFAQPLLYGAYIEDENDCDRRPGSSENVYTATTRLQLFLQTLIERPELAAKVEYLRLADLQDFVDGDLPNPEIGQIFVRASGNLPVIKDTSSSAGKRTKQSCVWRTYWRRHLRDGSSTEGAEVALLLMLVPRLQTLDLRTSQRNTGSDVQGLFRDKVRTDEWKLDTKGRDREVLLLDSQGVSASSRLPVLLQLKAVTLIAEAECPIDWHFLTLLAAAPSLETLSLVGDIETFDPSVFWRWPFDHIRSLSLKECTLGKTDLKSIVTSCGSLQSLRIKFSAHKQDMNIDLETLLGHLHQSSETLQELQISKPNGSPATIIAPAAFDLRPLHKLKTLEINFDFLFSPTSNSEPSFTSLLPTSLEDISFRVGDKRFAKHLQVLVEEHKSFPSLRVVDIGIDDMPSIHAMDRDEVDWKLALNNCAKELRKRGIECNVPVEGGHFNLSCGDD